MSKEELIKILEEVKEPKASVFFRLSLITHNLGELTRDIAYVYRLPQEAKAHKANIKISLADLLTQLSILCLDLGLKEDKIRELGLQRFREKCAEFKKRGWVGIER